MEKLNGLKKPAPPSDWHCADIVAALWKSGWTLRRLSISHGYEAGSAKKALRNPWPRMERIIAHAIGVEPWDIWPSRYDEDHNRAIGVRRRLRALQSINPPVSINVKKRRSR
ncbi:MAG: helix-turn-helix domain-containing protein [Deltaproteobacteria bacterium]|nr:helix-turn-helix domain-containing protein [Deltaproteobacteria bacterium]